ncbi:Circularly permutated Ras protein 1 [Oryzias melastigma]|uniref:Circularly permutated Ras protein 1 n=1 Tax=Oryzias melastigma TaxID=30732 RepID=A0A834KXF7_ORYME|nr:Circularly permutated Ras protein 1 [Oryzias melastigma]
MEFACGFVYVPSLLVQRNNQRPNVVKRSALLPPANRMRPRSPPPPPPTHTAKNKEQERSQEVKVKKSSTSFYENAQFHINREDNFHHECVSSADKPQPKDRVFDAVAVLYHIPPEAIIAYSISSVTYGESNSFTSGTFLLRSLWLCLDSFDNDVNECYFCRPWDCPDPPHIPSNDLQDGLFLLNPNEKPQSADSLILFCIDVSGSMSITSEVLDGEHISRLQFVQEAVVQCVQRLSEQQPDTRVGLITFSYQVTIHGYENFASQLLSGAELTKIKHLKKVAASLPNPPPISQTREFLQRQVMGLSANGTTALGPAALLAIAMASRQPGSKVIICTDGKANAKLGNLEDEDIDAQTLLSSTIFYQELGEYAANQGVMVSVLSIEGTDCRLDELGRLADRTGGKVVIASPNRLHSEFEQIIQNRTIATQCTVTLLLPRSLRLKGEKEAGHKGTREVGNVNQDAEITFQFGANEESKYVPAPGSRVSIQLQIKYRQRNGQTVLRVFTADQEVTDDSSAVLSSLSLTIIQLNSSQASAALAVRGRLLDAKKEGEMQLKLIERAIEHNRSTEEQQTFKEWVKTMEPLYNNIHSLARNKSTISDSQSLTDAGAALLYTLKHSNRKSISLKKEYQR